MNFNRFRKPEDDNVENYQNRIVYDITKNLSLAKPTVTWDDVCGMEKEKYIIQQDVLMPIILSESRMEVVINSRDILLYGPSGVGKTLLVQALAAQLKSAVFLIEGKDFIDTHRTKSADVIKRIFRGASQCYRAIVLINDIDRFYQGVSHQHDMRNQVRAEISKQLSQDSGRLNFFIIATTTQPMKLSWTLLTRRAFTRVYISLPDLATRQALLNKSLKGHPHKLTSSNIKDLATRMDGLTSKDIISIVKYACYEPIREAQKGKFFKAVGGKSPSKKVQFEMIENGNEEDKRELLDISVEEEVKYREVRMEDFEKALREVERFESWDQVDSCEAFKRQNE